VNNNVYINNSRHSQLEILQNSNDKPFITIQPTEFVDSDNPLYYTNNKWFINLSKTEIPTIPTL